MAADKDIDINKAIRVAIAATEREDYEGALRLFRDLYGRPELKAPPEGLSYYGLCVAIAEKQTNKGVQLCEEAIETQFYDSSHHLNLVRIHLAKGSRRRAVRALIRGLKKVPGDPELEKLHSEIGFRHGGAIPFLDRDHWLNKAGAVAPGSAKKEKKIKAEPKSGRFDLGQLLESKPVRTAVAILAFAIIYGMTVAVLYQQAYG